MTIEIIHNQSPQKYGSGQKQTQDPWICSVAAIMVLSGEQKTGAGQTVQILRLVCIFIVPIPQNQVFPQ